ncbi:MAG TPA: esterase-like activity of phytase family protein [Caulobacteraceae bacterium]
MLAACAAPVVTPPPLPTEPMPVEGLQVLATPVPLNAGDPKQERVGNFVYAGGVQLTSHQTSRLHGLSDLKIKPDGTLIAVSDEGDLFEGRLVLDAAGRLVGLEDTSLKPLRGNDGTLQGKENADAEGFAILPSADWLISFERNHRIWRYPAGGGAVETANKPNTLFSDNEGMEALTAYPAAAPDAYLVGGEEGEMWLCRLTAPCTPTPRQQPPSLEHGLTALAAFDGPAIAILYRAWDPIRGARATVRIIDDPLRPKPAPRVLDSFTIDGALTRDNFEGLALVRNDKGGARLYLLSDDNFSGSQRTLLMAFDWVPPVK